MITMLERTGDRLLSRILPRSTATAHHCWYESRFRTCPDGGGRFCKYHCCNPGGCVLVSCGSCFI